MGRPYIWIKFKYLKLPDFCYGCGVLGHTLKACEVLDPETLVSEPQYGAWLRASLPKSRRRSAKSELAEERHLFTAFQNSRTNHASRKKLSFDASLNPCSVEDFGDGKSGRENIAHMLIDEREEVPPLGDVFKRKLRVTGKAAGHDKIEVDTGKIDAYPEWVEVAHTIRSG